MKRFDLGHAIAISVLVSIGVFVEVQVSSTAADGNTGQGDVVRMLDEKRVMLRDMSGSATEAIKVLRDKYGVPVSFISIPNEKLKTVESRDEELTLQGALDEFVRSREGYSYALVGDRLVVYPKVGPFEKVIDGVDIRNAPRLEATVAFVDHLKRTHLAFGSLGGPGIKGDRRAPLYTEPVSLLEEATVLEHLAALLGDNPNVMFSIVDGRRPGTRFFVLEELKSSSEAKRPAEAKDRRTTKSPGD